MKMKRKWNPNSLLLTAFVLVSTPGLAAAQSADTATAALTDQQKEEFLHSAKITAMKSLSVGINNTHRATLTDGKTTRYAHVQSVDIRKSSYRTPSGGNELNFRDSYKYNIAAYKLDRMLGLNMIPVSVERKVDRESSSVTWWVDFEMMEKERYQKKMPVPSASRINWNDQMYQTRVFNELVYSTDANLGNILITEGWNIRLIDFTRAFRTRKTLRAPKDLTRCDRRIYNAMQELNGENLTRELGEYLTKSEIQGILARRDKIIKFFNSEIAAKGEAAVICDLEGH